MAMHEVSQLLTVLLSDRVSISLHHSSISSRTGQLQLSWSMPTVHDQQRAACWENPGLLVLCFLWLVVFRAFLEALSVFLAHGVLTLVLGALGI